MKKKKKYRVNLKMNISKAREEIYIAVLGRRYKMPRAKLSRLAIKALKEIVAMETENPLMHLSVDDAIELVHNVLTAVSESVKDPELLEDIRDKLEKITKDITNA